MKYTNLLMEWGLSENLGESPYAEARIYNDFSEHGWIIHIHPSELDNVSPYFKIYKNCSVPGVVSGWSAKTCARISMVSPEYIHCDDCSLESWILSHDERNHLCNIIAKVWRFLLSSYSDELEWITGNPHLEILELQMPDYSKLPILEEGN